MGYEFYLLLLFITLSGFFSASEIALFSLSHSKVRALQEQKLKNSKVLAALKAKPQKLLITILIGNNLVNIAASSLATYVAIQQFGSAGVGIATGVMTFVILLFGEIIPKSLGQRNPKKVALLIAPLIRFVMLILWPLVMVMNFFTIAFQKIARIKEMKATVSEAEVRAMVNLGSEEGSLERDEKEMIEKVFLLNDITAEDVMTPDEYIVSFDTETTLAEALPIMQESGYSRFPIVSSGKDNSIEGIVYIKDVFSFLVEKVAEVEADENGDHGEILEATVSEFMKPPLFVPETTQIDDLMKDLQKKHKHIGIVVDEHGTVRGLVTLEDLLEEIVGEIIDETDVDSELIKRIDGDTILLDPRVMVSKVNHFFNTDLKAQKQKTIGWLVLKEFGKIPSAGDSIKIQDYNFIIEEAEDRRIKRLKMIKTAKVKARLG